VSVKHYDNLVQLSREPNVQSADEELVRAAKALLSKYLIGRPGYQYIASFASIEIGGDDEIASTPAGKCWIDLKNALEARESQRAGDPHEDSRIARL